MTKIIALAIVGATLAIATPSFAGEPSITSFCGPDAPEAYKRPGGFCEGVAGNDSLTGDPGTAARPVRSEPLPA